MEKILKGRFGLERETLRVDKNGKMARTPHPFEEKSLTRDFCENQLEIVTPVCESIDEAIKSLEELSQKAEKKLNENEEYLWLNSNPPHIESEDDIPIARFQGEERGKHSYRCYLEQKYGKRLMLYSGIHFNISFDIEKENKNDFYMKLLKQATKNSWLLVLLTAASPVYDKSLETDNFQKSEKTAFDGKSSMRNSEKGYWNNFVPVLDYSNLNAYCESIKNYIEKGVLVSAGELYVPVRIKPVGENTIDSLERNGADHIELRMFDINPLSPLGIIKEDLEFAYLFLVYSAGQPDFDFTEDMQKQAFENHKKAALYDISNVKIGEKNIKDSALEIIEDMKNYFSCSNNFADIKEVLDYQTDKLKFEKMYSKQILEIYGMDFQENMTKQVTLGGVINV